MDDFVDHMKLYEFHGVHFVTGDNGGEALAECPWCGKEKFSLLRRTGQWYCFVCGEKGNDWTFLDKLYSLGKEATSDVEYKELKAHRSLHFVNTLKHWNVVKSVLTKQWLVPAFNERGKLKQLYRYVKMKDGKQRLLVSPKPLQQQLFGLADYDSKKQTIWLCEGPWDAMALWETMKRFRDSDNGLVRVKEGEENLLAGVNVLAVPGCNVFMQDWLPLFKDKVVIVCFDNDHPKKNEKTGKLIEGAGLAGVKRVKTMLHSAASEVYHLQWGQGEEVNLALPNGFDVRDHLNKG